MRGWKIHLLMSVLALLLNSCGVPHIPAGDSEKYPHNLIEGFRAERWHYLPVSLSIPLQMGETKNIAGTTTQFLLALPHSLLFSTYNGLLATAQIPELADIDYKRLDGLLSAPPAFQYPLVFQPMETGKFGLIAYDLRAGKELWKLRKHYGKTNPLLMDNQIFHASLDGSVLCINQVNGREIWKFVGEAPIDVELTSRDNLIIVVDVSQNLYALDRYQGRLCWTQKIEHPVLCAPLIVDTLIYLLDIKGQISAFHRPSGKLLRRQACRSPFHQPCSSDGERIYCMSSDGLMRTLTLDLKPVWIKRLQGNPTTPILVTRDHLLVGTGEKLFYILDKKTGKIVQKMELQGRPCACGVANDGTIYLGLAYKRIQPLYGVGLTGGKP